MSLDRQTVTITAEHAPGVYYGIRSLMMMISKSTKVPISSVLDAPRLVTSLTSIIR